MARVTLYLVRHAESEANAERIHQHRDTPLHARATAQIAALGQRVHGLGVQTLVASPYVLQQILDLNSPTVLAVSHAAIIRVIVACAMFGPRLTPHDYMGFWHTAVDNVSLTHLVHNPDAADMSPWGNPWKLLSFNSRTSISATSHP